MYIFLYLIFYRITPEETALYSIYYVIEYNIKSERGRGGRESERQVFRFIFYSLKMIILHFDFYAITVNVALLHYCTH